MKKTAFILLLATFACSKEQKPVNCYECEMTYASGQPASVQFPCTTDIDKWQKAQKDNNGDPINSACKDL